MLTRQRQHRFDGDTHLVAHVKRQSYLLPGFPSDYIDIWPDHRHQSKLLHGSVLRNHCLQSNHRDSCIGREASNDSEEIEVILIRSPGVFGRLLDDFFSAFVKTLGGAGKKIHAVHTVVLDDSHIRDKEKLNGTRVMIRLAVLPPALEAMDLALALSNNDRKTPIQMNEEDLTEAMRLWAAWHCSVTTLAQETYKDNLEIPLLTIPLDLLLAYPMKAENQLADFLGITLPPEEKRKHVPMERRIRRSLDRIDECYDLSISLPIFNVPKVPDCSFTSSSTRLRKQTAPWVMLARRILIEGESHNSVCRTAKQQLPICQ